MDSEKKKIQRKIELKHLLLFDKFPIILKEQNLGRSSKNKFDGDDVALIFALFPYHNNKSTRI